MKIRTFIERPVLSIVVAIAMALLGLIALHSLPIEQFPAIAPPTVYVSATYPGASAETVQKSVIVPLEEAINGVEGMDYIASTASNTGEAEITVYFRQGTDPDMAAVNVQNRVSTATGELPAEVTKGGVTTNKQQKSMLKAISLYSPDASFDTTFLNNYMSLHIVPRLKRVPGVGEVMLMGSNYSMRLWLKPDAMSQYGLVPADITAALEAQNVEAATGSFGEQAGGVFQYPMKYRGRFSTPEEFGNIVIKSRQNGETLRLKEVADVSLGDQAYNYVGMTNGRPGTSIMVYQTSGANAMEVIAAIDKVLEEVSRELPSGTRLVDLFSTKDFLQASMQQVIKTLVEAFVLVVLIVLLFLQSGRATLIPTISILVSLISTFAVMYLIGFTLNLLTLFALVLAIGIVVDDAIIVVEAVQARFEDGYKSSFMATADAMGGITSAIITTTLVFMAVFVPVAGMGGASGAFYRQFGITMAIATGLSAVNALTLAPALCALILKPDMVDEEGRHGFRARFRAAFNAAFRMLARRYANALALLMRHKALAFASVALAAGLLAWLMDSTKTGFVPDEDTGSIMVNISMPPGSSLERTAEAMSIIDKELADIPQIESYMETAGYGLLGGAGPSSGMVIAKLKDWSQRTGPEDNLSALLEKINGMGPKLPDAAIFAMAPPMIDGYGVANGFEIHLQDKAGRTPEELGKVARDFMDALLVRPEIATAYTTYNVNFPQYLVEVDAARCLKAGTTADAVLSTLSGYYGGQYVSNFNRFSKLYRVMIQAAPSYRETPESLTRLYTKVADGKTAPLSEFVKLTKCYGPESLNRFNLYNSMSINGEQAEGYSSGDAIRAIRETAQASLPKGYGFEFSGISREESGTGNNTAIIFALCFIFVYLILCALYESFFIPFAVLLPVPAGLLGSFLFAKAAGLDNNIYLQTGLIMLIGFLAKTAILLTGYATERRRAGMGIAQAAMAAAKARLRPILMTVLAMVFGMLPLMFSHGAGANGNNALSTGVVGGMLLGSLAVLLLTPALFVAFQYLQEKVKPVVFESHPDWEIQKELEELNLPAK